MGVHVSKWLCTRQPAKSAIYTAAGCQHIIAIYTAADPEQFQNIYTAAVCLHYLHGSHSRAKSAIYIAAGRIQKIVIYTAVIKEPNRLYTSMPGVYIKLLFTRQPFKCQLGYMHCCRVYIHEIVIYTAAVQEPTRLYTLPPTPNWSTYIFTLVQKVNIGNKK